MFFPRCSSFFLKVKVKVHLSLSNRDEVLVQSGLYEVHLHILATSTLDTGD